MDSITTELAGKVLTANVRNIIQKVQDGGRLTGGEIKLFEQYTLEQTELHNTRQGALIRKWSSGGRLTEDEKSEISGIVPVVTKEPPVAKRPQYRHEQKQYAETYNQSDRTIKRWVSKGRKAGDPPPLDDPAQMPQWWPRHYKHKVPDCLIEAGRAQTPPPEPPPPAAVIGEKEAPGIEIGMGFKEMLERVKRAEASAYQEFDTALKSNDESRLPAARKIWSELSKQLRELERDAHDILSRSGALVEKSSVEKIIADIHGPIVNGIRSMWRRVKTKMLTAPDSQQDRVWQEEVDRLLSRLNESEFTSHE